MKKIAIILFAIVCASMCFIGCDNNSAYTISYTHGNVYTVRVTEGEMYNLTYIPTMDGYVFDGLYDSESGGIKYVDSDGYSLTPFTDGRDVTLYVRFVPRTYDFEFIYSEGTLSADGATNAVYGNAMTDLPILNVDENRIFNGWYTAEEDGNAVTDGAGHVENDFKIFDYQKYETGEENSVKLYASVEQAKRTVKFYDNSNGENLLIEERTFDYGTDIIDAAKGIKLGIYDVTAWATADGDIFNGSVVRDEELFVKYYGTVIDLETVGARTIQLAGDTSVLLCGQEGKSYASVNVSIGSGTDNPAIVLLHNAQFGGSSSNGTIVSASNRSVHIYSFGYSNEIGASVNASAINIAGDLCIYGNANLTVRGGNGADSTAAGRAGNNGASAISANDININMQWSAAVICYGGKGGNGFTGADATGKSTGSHYPDSGGSGSNGGNGGIGISASAVAVLSGEAVCYGGIGGNGGNAGKGQDSSHSGRDAAGSGGSGGNGGVGGIGLSCDSLYVLQATVSLYGGNGGNGGNGGRGGSASNNDWYDQTDYGGSGGSGGHGGNGGIGIFAKAVDIDAYYSAKGGTGGSGGNGGSGGSGYAYGSNGSNGNAGKDGEAINGLI